MNKVHFIVNPRASQGRSASIAGAIRRLCDTKGWPAHVHVLDGVALLDAFFAAQPAGLRVVAVGGDGTCHQMLPHVLKGHHEMAVLPTGSGNDWARANGLLGRDFEWLVEHALRGQARPVDVGLIEGREANQRRHFLCCMLFGLDALVSNLTQRWKSRGPLPYTLTLLGMLPKLPSWSLGIEIEGDDGRSDREVPSPRLLCSVMNTPTYGSGYPVAPMASVDDGQLDLMTLERVGRWRFVSLFRDMLRGHHVQAPEFRFRRMRACRVSSGADLCLSSDGERIDWRTRTARVRVLPAALKMVSA